MSSQHWIGQHIGDYLLTEVLGEGGMGVVFKGLQERLNQVVAIKMLHPSLVADESLRSRFVREAQALARLNHPNVVRLLNFINRQDNCFIIMEFMAGQAVDEILNASGPIPELKAAEYFVQVLAAMHYAHALGIIHRDIKPSNIAVCQDGMIKVLDFGTAKIIGAQQLTQEGMTLGTLIYMSPEQICGRELDHRSDIYSLGVTLYEMVTGHVPHFCEDEMQLVSEIARGTPDPPRKYNPYLSAEFERVILKAIEKDPARRYQTAEEFLRDLNAFISTHKQQAAPVPPPEAPRAPKEEQEAAGAGNELGFRPGLLIGAIAALVGFVALGLALVVAADLGAAGGAVMGLGVLAAIVLCVLSFVSTGSKAQAPEAPPPEAFGEATIALDEPEHAPVPPPAKTERDAEAMPPPPGAYDAPQQAQHVPAYLYVTEGPDQGSSWPLPYGAVTIGRGEHNTILLSDGGVSTTHAQVGFDGQRFVLTDLQSRNGCYVNNQRVGAAHLNDRDVIIVGSTHLVFALTQQG